MTSLICSLIRGLFLTGGEGMVVGPIEPVRLAELVFGPVGLAELVVGPIELAELVVGSVPSTTCIAKLASVISELPSGKRLSSWFVNIIVWIPGSGQTADQRTT